MPHDPPIRTAPGGAGIAEALRTVKCEIAAACQDAGRERAAVTLVAITKMVPIATIATAIDAGQKVFGENRVQEAKSKWPLLRQRGDLELHLVGPLQSNKAKDAVALFDVIHSVDRIRLVEALANETAKQAKHPRLLVQVNTGEEQQKAGVAPKAADAFIATCRDTYGLAIEGLMCIPPVHEPPAPHFALLKQIAVRNQLHLLSMGMSDDFKLAIGFGATHVRVGTAIFGARGQPPPH